MNNDTISRKAAISIPLTPKEHRKYQTMNLDDAYDEGWGDYQACIAIMPSAERRGTWTTRRTMYHDGETYCDQCGWTWEDITHGRINVTRTPFCPNCGAKMRMTRE